MPAPAAGRDHGGAGQLPGQHGCPAAGAQAGRGGESGQALGVSGQHPGSLGGPRNTGQQQSHKKNNMLLTSALLCYKDTAQGTQSLLLGALGRV